MKCSINILLFLILFMELWAFDSDDLQKIKTLQEVLNSGNRYTLYTAELFDGDTPWRIIRGTSFLETTSFVSKSPTTEAYKLESKLYYPAEDNPKPKSIQVHSNIEIPGRDKIFIKPEIVKPISIGTPVRIFFWVYSNNYDINMKVILSQKKSQDIVVDFGLLKFNGWRRMDARVTTYKPQDRLNLAKFSQFELKGVLLESSFSQARGSFYIFLDQMGILVEKPETYPGSEVPDGWELY